ncbi:serine/threonine-protein kinase [Planktothrix agardhii]|uniref:serine/threonine-protein kinase n=1 Tax=Planktothrix agardhii TaxID=1160 RepID=UPI002B1F74E1|nr:serine/threonine-protein kinase [Planktothrix agardhii]MEA5562217.1 serine/threonine-protein kinase [Planktothrix agardhii UHCC 0887]
MSYCLNPQCPQPQNTPEAKFCLTCGAKLLLRERYRAVKVIGHGGFGKTFLAVDEDKPSRPACVIKQFHPQMQGNSQKAIELFHREAERLDELGKHPQIPELLAHFEQENHQYLVQEFINGPNLEAEILDHGIFNEAQIRQVLDDLLPVLQFIHHHRVIHRDIKPANIILREGSLSAQLPLVRPDFLQQLRGESSPQNTPAGSQPQGQLVLVDFGAAKVVTDTEVPIMGTVIGSPEYVAPEQTRGQAIYSSDIYSLGVTCIYLMTQISPFDLYDIHEDRWIWRDYLKQNYVSSELGKILDKMLAVLPSQRYDSALKVLKDLHPSGIPVAIARHLQTPSPPTPPLQTVRTPAPSPSQTLPPRTTQQLTPAQQQRVQPLQAPSWKCVHTLSGHRNAITGVAFSPDSQTLASGSQDQTIEIWRLDSGKRWYTLVGHSNWITTIAFSPDSKTLASGSRDQTIEIWDMTKGKRWYTLTGHQDGVEAVAFSPNGQFLASGSRDKSIEIWNMNKGKRGFTLTGHQDRVYSVAFSLDSQKLASGSRDQTVKIWDLNTAKEVQSLTGHGDWVRSVAFSLNGQLLASASKNGMIRIWQKQQEKWGLLRTLRADDQEIFNIIFSPDNRFLVSGGGQGIIDIWDVQKGILLETIKAHESDVFTLAFSGDGQWLATGSYDRTVKLWKQ